MLSTKFAAGTAAAALTIFGGLTAASATNADVASATGHVLPFAASSAKADTTADKTNPPAPKADAADTEAPEQPEATETTEKPDTTDAKPSGTSSNCTTGEAHGDAVSTAAHAETTGQAHGAAVSSVASCNGTAHASTSGDATSDEAKADATAKQSSNTPGANKPSSNPGDPHADVNAPTRGDSADSPGATHH